MFCRLFPQSTFTLQRFASFVFHLLWFYLEGDVGEIWLNVEKELQESFSRSREICKLFPFTLLSVSFFRLYFQFTLARTCKYCYSAWERFAMSSIWIAKTKWIFYCDFFKREISELTELRIIGKLTRKFQSQTFRIKKNAKR